MWIRFLTYIHPTPPPLFPSLTSFTYFSIIHTRSLTTQLHTPPSIFAFTTTSPPTTMSMIGVYPSYRYRYGYLPHPIAYHPPLYGPGMIHGMGMGMGGLGMGMGMPYPIAAPVPMPVPIPNPVPVGVPVSIPASAPLPYGGQGQGYGYGMNSPMHPQHEHQPQYLVSLSCISRN